MKTIFEFKNELGRYGNSVLKKHDLNFQEGELNSLKILANWIKKIDNFDHRSPELDLLSKDYDIKARVYVRYDPDWKGVGKEVLNSEFMQIFAGFLFLRVLLANAKSIPEDRLLKFINVCWKVFDAIDLPNFMIDAPKYLFELQDALLEDPLKVNRKFQNIEVVNVPNGQMESSRNFSVLPIDVLFYENPIGRAYLEMLYSMRLKPRQIVHLIPERDIVTKKKIGRFLPTRVRQNYLHGTQAMKITHWPKYLLRKHKEQCNHLFAELQKQLYIDESSIRGLTNLKPLESYANEVYKLTFDGFKDPRFIGAIKEAPSKLILYTGGGIIPKIIFDDTDAKLLHIHPGYLPDIKGADCFYWSYALTGRPSATCFIMNSGIDTGAIINAKFLPRLDLSNSIAGLDQQMIYRLIYSFADPWIRASVLRDTISNTNNFQNVEAIEQDVSEGTTFHFMHAELKYQVVKSRFSQSPS